MTFVLCSRNVLVLYVKLMVWSPVSALLLSKMTTQILTYVNSAVNIMETICRVCK